MNIALKSISKQQMVKDKIRELIVREGLKPGDQILSQNNLARAFKVNPLTVVKALSDLCEERLLYRENGRGTFVGDGIVTRKTRKICLVLPEKDLDRPENNPVCWVEVQQWFMSFMECMKKNMTFTSVLIPMDDSSKVSLDKLADFDVTFFLSPKGYEKLIKAMQNKNISCPVCIDEPQEGLDCLFLPFDRSANISTGISHMLASGYRKIAFLYPDFPWLNEGLKTYRKTMAQAGIIVNDDWLIKGNGEFKEAMESLLERGPFDAIFAADTVIGSLAVNYLQRNGFRVPEDIGVMADEGIEPVVSRPPYLTAVMFPYRQIIKFALDFMEANNYKYKKAYRQAFSGELYSGKTCSLRKIVGESR